jgi:branched-chain amino acid transport system substrate-binding protein
MHYRCASVDVSETEAAIEEGRPYKVGFAPEVTGSGSFLGERERKVAEIIAARSKAAGGIVRLDGIQYEGKVLIGDIESNRDVAVSLPRRYIEDDEVEAVVAGSVTPISLAIAKVAEESQVPAHHVVCWFHPA